MIRHKNAISTWSLGWQTLAVAFIWQCTATQLVQAQTPLPTQVGGDKLVVTDSIEAGSAETEPITDPFKVYPVEPQEIYVVSGGGAASNGIAAAAEKLIYDNPLGSFATEFPADYRVADDITFSVKTGCPLTRYRFQIIGKANPDACGGAGMTCGPLRVDFALYDECPSAGGAVIDGTPGCASTEPGAAMPSGAPCLFLPDADTQTEINFVPSIPVALPSRVWLATTMSRAGAGVIIGAPALKGFSSDVIDTVSFACNSSVGGFPTRPYSSFNASVYGDATCTDTFLTYQNTRADNSGVNEGSNICIADDITLNRTCNMSQLEVAVRGLGRYDLELRRSSASGPIGNCNSIPAFGVSAIPGTRTAFGSGPGDGLFVFRKNFDPPIPLPNENLFAVLMPNNVNAKWVLTRQDASIGSTDATYFVFDGGPNGGTWNSKVRPGNIHGGYHIVITCEGSPPVGACCDMFIRDPAGEAVCRDVPEINCGVTFAHPSFQPSWVEGLSCADEPFPHPCGQAACCEPDNTCENLTQNECDAVEPLDRPRIYHQGQYCGEQGQTCPNMICLNQVGDCLLAHDGVGCSDPYCCTDVCASDSWCCDVEWDLLCEREANDLCQLSPTNDDCAPGPGMTGQAGAVEVVVDGPAMFARQRNATSPVSDPPFSCNGGQRHCVGGCAHGEVCRDDSDCVGASAGYCDFGGYPINGACVGGCNDQITCFQPFFGPETYCVGGVNNQQPCAPRCEAGANAGQGCGDDADCPGSICSHDADCPDGTCDNTFCEGTPDGYCASAVPEPGVPGVGSVWFYFTVPDGPGPTLDVEVSTCGSYGPAEDSMVQVYAIGDNDSGLCTGEGRCDGDGSLCHTAAQDCSDGTDCIRVDVPCSVAAQDCSAGFECTLNRVEACNSLTLLGCNDNAQDGCGDPTQSNNSKLCLTNLRRGDTYYVLVAAKSRATRGTYRVTAQSVSSCTGGTIESPYPPGNPEDGLAALSASDTGNSHVNPLTHASISSGPSGSHSEPVHLERPDDPFMARSSTPPPGVVAGRTVVERDGFISVQVNVDQFGNNIPGDAANEPSIAVDPTNPSRMVIGWRQFDTIKSNFRQAGVGYSHDAGATWSFPGPLTPGTFRSDPVVVANADGLFHYFSLGFDLCSFQYDVFTSADGGVTWGDPVFAFGGDKGWATVDTTGGPGRNNLYETWTEGTSCTSGSFSRSTDRGGSFEGPIYGTPWWGTLTVDLNGVLYAAGVGSGGGYVAISDNAQDSSVPPTFDRSTLVDLGGYPGPTGGPNPRGLLGQVWIRSDLGSGPRAGDLYVLGSVSTANSLDVMFARSEDGGFTWSDPVPVNDDAANHNATHWFGMMDVAPNGRIDVVWNDNRNSAQMSLSELYYAFSTDGGRTWSKNIPVSPVFDSWIGWPNQNKIGDYYDMASDNGGANIAYAATFNGEQDVYFLRIGIIDCNENGIPDVDDIASGFSNDCDGNTQPDECGADCDANGLPDVCELLAGAADCDGNNWLDICQGDFDGDGIIDACDPDRDNDGIPNEVDLCPKTPNGVGALADGRPRPDTTGDCEVDLRDYWRFLNCSVGGQLGAPPPWDACLERFDADDNMQLNLRDAAVFQNAYSGPGG